MLFKGTKSSDTYHNCLDIFTHHRQFLSDKNHKCTFFFKNSFLLMIFWHCDSSHNVIMLGQFFDLFLVVVAYKCPEKNAQYHDLPKIVRLLCMWQLFFFFNKKQY